MSEHLNPSDPGPADGWPATPPSPGGDAVPPPPPPGWPPAAPGAFGPPPVPPGPPPPGAYPPQPPGYPPPGPGVPPGAGGGWQTATTRNGMPGRSALLAIVAVFAALAGGFAVVNISSGGQSGAQSPEAAVEEFFAAVSDQDVIGVLEMLEPAERETMVPFVRDLESNLTRLGLTEPVDLSDVSGVDLEVTGLEVEATELEAGMSEVLITDGEISYETLPDDVPIGDVLRDLIEANEGEVDIQADSDTQPLTEDEEVFLVAMETDGRWHVSLGFSAAEYARRSDDQPRPALADGVEPNGADSPEEAVQELAAAASDLDLERLIALLPPDSMRALQVYAPLFLADAQEEIDESVADEGLEFEIEIGAVDTTGVDGGTRVTPTDISISYETYESGESTMTFDGECFEVSGDLADDLEEDLGDTRACWDDIADLDEDLSDEARVELEELMALFEDFEPGIVVVEVDGQHYVDPVRTFSDVLVQVLEGVDRSDLEEGGILYRLFTGGLTLFDDVIGGDDWDDDLEYEDDWGDDSYDDDGEDDLAPPPIDDDYEDVVPDEDYEDPFTDDSWDERWETEDEWIDDFFTYEAENCFPYDVPYDQCLDDFWDEHGDEYSATEETEVS